MRSFDGIASTVVPAQAQQCFALLAAVDAYPRWNPDLVRRADVLARDASGLPAMVAMAIHVAESPIAKNFDVRMAVTADPPRSVSLTRAKGSWDLSDLALRWELFPADGTRIELTFHASTSLLPRFIPLPDVGDEIARRLVDAAARALTGGWGPLTAETG